MHIRGLNLSLVNFNLPFLCCADIAKLTDDRCLSWDHAVVAILFVVNHSRIEFNQGWDISSRFNGNKRFFAADKCSAVV